MTPKGFFRKVRFRILLFLIDLFIVRSGLATAITWTGASSTDWFTTGNWASSAGPVVPTSADSVTLTNGNSRYPVISSGSAGATTIGLGASGTGAAATLTLSGGTLVIGGAITISGSAAITNSGGTIVQSSGTLTINSGASLTQSGGSNSLQALSISGTLSLTGGTNVCGANATINNGGTITNSGGVLWMAANTATAPAFNIAVNGALKQSGGTNAVKDLSGTGTMAMTGGLLKEYHDYNPTTPANFAATGGTVEFAASAGGTAFSTLGTFQFFNVLIDSGVDPSFNTRGNTIIIGGNWTNNGAPALSGTTVAFNGVGPQNVAGVSATTFNNLTITNNAGVSLLGVDATVTNALTVGKGTLATGANTMIMASGGSVSRPGSTPGFVQGNLRKQIDSNGTVTRTYEVGTGSSYTPVDVVITSVSGSATSGSQFLTASSTGVDHPNLSSSGINTARSVNRYWTLTKGGTWTFASYSETNTFVPGDIDGGSDTTAFVVKRFASGTWSTPSIGTRSSTNTSASGLTGFGDFAVGDPAGSITTTVLTATPTSVCAGSLITFTAGVTNNGVPVSEGAVTFYDNNICSGTVLANVVVVDANGRASFSTTSLSAGNHTVTACYGGTGNFAASSGTAATTLNPTPVAPSPGISSNLAKTVSMKIRISSLLAAWGDAGGGPPAVQSAGPTSAGGGTVSKDNTYIYYIPPGGSPSGDSIPYTVAGTNGCITSASIAIVFVGAGGIAQTISTSGGAVTVTFAGIPGYVYDVERATDPGFSSLTVLLTTNTPAAGLFIYTDNSPPQPTAYYRLRQH